MLKGLLLVCGALTLIGTIYGWTIAYGLMKKTSMTDEEWEQLHSEK
jgi:hypothetical protein